ncbi:DUF3231 family protein [Neobacillus sp. NPDC093182]|uniref:DUF3231 family protein n=1 Tax=Neobacillus sp. NPDC093182 TaxID=3364297 RepID=UPI003815C913
MEEKGLSAAEIASLWTSYLNVTMSTCLMKHFIFTVEDKEIKQVVEYAYDLSLHYTEEIKRIFEKESFPIPHGFTDKDLNRNTPRLFTDLFMINFIKSMAKVGLSSYAISRTLSTRQDIRAIFKTCIETTQELDDKAIQVMLNKGVLIRPPYLPIPEKVHFVKTKNFMSGFIGKRRPLTAPEITQLFVNLDSNLLGSNLMTAFAQVAKSKQIREMMWRGKQIAEKHAKVFAQKLREDNLPAPSLWDTSITESQEAPFSDKIMLFVTTFLNAAGLGNYGLSVASSMRHDLAFLYARLASEIGLYAEDAAHLLIQNGWMEEPPQSPDRRNLVNDKELK